MSTHEIVRPEGGPLERNHMKGMVQRNTLESVAFTKIAKHLETEKKAFVRQSTRDEEEMKHLLHRLQFKQQSTTMDDGTDSDEDPFTCTGESEEDENIVVNPYPVTIIPKFGTNSNSTKPNTPSSKLGNHCKLTRKKSSDYDDVNDSASVMTSSSVSISEANMNDVTPEWLASPNAISSVRRLRKSIPEQIQRKILIRGNSEASLGLETPASPVPCFSHSRSNSLKERKKSMITGEDTYSQKSFGMDGRRAGSLKERKQSQIIDENDERKLWRSYSMLSSSSIHGGLAKSDMRNGSRLSNRKQSNSDAGSDETCKTIGHKIKEKDQNRPMIRKNSKKK